MDEREVFSIGEDGLVKKVATIPKFTELATRFSVEELVHMKRVVEDSIAVQRSELMEVELALDLKRRSGVTRVRRMGVGLIQRIGEWSKGKAG